MFDIGALELLLIAAVAIVVIGPKDMPMALRQLGRFVGKMRRVSSQFRAGFDAMVREAELEEMEKEWKERNKKIMAENAGGSTKALPEPAKAVADADSNSDSNSEKGESKDADAGAQADEPKMEPLNPPAASEKRDA